MEDTLDCAFSCLSTSFFFGSRHHLTVVQEILTNKSNQILTHKPFFFLFFKLPQNSSLHELVSVHQLQNNVCGFRVNEGLVLGVCANE